MKITANHRNVCYVFLTKDAFLSCDFTRTIDNRFRSVKKRFIQNIQKCKNIQDYKERKFSYISQKTPSYVPTEI